jgi:hypothetical protein
MLPDDILFVKMFEAVAGPVYLGCLVYCADHLFCRAHEPLDQAEQDGPTMSWGLAAGVGLALSALVAVLYGLRVLSDLTGVSLV